MIEILDVHNDLLKPSTNGSTFPPQNNDQHTIEYYFYQHLISENKYKSNLSYLPIQWEGILDNQSFDKTLVNNELKKYQHKNKMFTVSRLTGGPRFDINNCIIFTTGGIFDTPPNDNLSHIPLPLIADKYLDVPINEKNLIASYIGRNTHPIRVHIEKLFKRNNKFLVKNLDSMDATFNNKQQNEYKDIISRSYFSLSPRGYGPTSFRLYESIELGSVPVYISDKFLLPFSDILDWDNLCVKIKFRDLPNLKNILNDILKSGKYKDMLDYGKYCHQNYFNKEFIIKYILETVSKF